ncbi:MAG: O-antigen ligase family protein [Rhizobium sp.]|nr:O-antigen ligase family protein [Rhizobium sp.]
MPASLQAPLAAAVLAAALLLGGGQGALGDSAVQLLSLILLALCLWRHASEAEAKLPRLAWLAALPLALPALQLLPLPESLWLLPDARGELATELSAAGVDAAHRMSLVPLATERAFAWLLPAVALFLAGLQLPHAQRVGLLKVMVTGAALSVVLGLAQLFGGPDSALRFYSNTNVRQAVGFFANRNHLASLLVVALPLVVVGSSRWLSRRAEWDARTVLGLVAGAGLVVLLMLGIAMARSRAGMVLGMLGLLLSLPLALRLRHRRGTRRALVVAVALGFSLAVQFALFGILQRLERDPLDDARFQYLGVVDAVARQHSPLGAGLGGFRRAFEAEDPAPTRVYVNHAHSDWAELWLEGGWPGWALAGAAVAGLLVCGWRVWRTPADASPAVRDFSRAAWVGVFLLALHSVADYPLRTTALLAVAGLLAAQAVAVREIRLSKAPEAARLESLFNP